VVPDTRAGPSERAGFMEALLTGRNVQNHELHKERAISMIKAVIIPQEGSVVPSDSWVPNSIFSRPEARIAPNIWFVMYGRSKFFLCPSGKKAAQENGRVDMRSGDSADCVDHCHDSESEYHADSGVNKLCTKKVLDNDSAAAAVKTSAKVPIASAIEMFFSELNILVSVNLNDGHSL